MLRMLATEGCADKALTGRREFLASSIVGIWLTCGGFPLAASREGDVVSPPTMEDSLVKTSAFKMRRENNRTLLETHGKNRRSILYEVDERGAFVLRSLPDLEGFYKGQRLTLRHVFNLVREAFREDESAVQRERFLRFASDLVLAGIAIRTDQYVNCVQHQRETR